MSNTVGAIVVFVLCLAILAPLFRLGLGQVGRARAATDDDVSSNFLGGVAFVFAFLASPLGILFSHLSLRQIARAGASGAGLAVAAFFIAYALTVIQLALLLWGSLTGYFH
ncbi:hypothetical protein [Subtercola sp. RTI3]|uniref:hypothetical protein n=1 Tax=Subtercola sp. RTI3 TaxID=3048639 RepID=UPI002B22A76E|nr:hypothetical protein [Subtercola sp. RTI3]MEA9985876.1 hypothetical protein [Subtercola sp. RTI3]